MINKSQKLSIFIMENSEIGGSPFLTCDLYDLQNFSKHWPSGPMLSISWFVRPSVCLSVFPSVCLSVYFLRYCLNVFLPPLPKVGCPNFLEIWNPWGKVIKRNGLRLKKNFFLIKGVKLPQFFFLFFFSILPYWAGFLCIGVFHSV